MGLLQEVGEPDQGAAHRQAAGAVPLLMVGSKWEHMGSTWCIYIPGKSATGCCGLLQAAPTLLLQACMEHATALQAWPAGTHGIGVAGVVVPVSAFGESHLSQL